MILDKTCKICGKSFNRVMSHIHQFHHLTTKNYFDIYYKTNTDGICIICSKPTKFIRTYYNKCCSQKCSAIYRQSLYNHQLDVEQFEKENNCTNIVKLRQLYGQGWYKSKIITNYIEKSFQTKTFFVKNEDISKIEEYTKLHQYSGKSHIEKQLVNYLKNMNIEVIENDKSIISPKELDIYLPKYNTAIEYNGTWFHSIEAGYSKDSHLQKSLLCREKGIRLIHIYEFEDFNEQLSLLKEYLNGNDLYNDFNKNNFLPIPKPELIYINDRGYHIYGAGKLERNYL